MKLIITIGIITLLLLAGCGDKAEDIQEDDFNTYCNSFCEAVDMEMNEGTTIEEHTLNCVCQKIFLKKDWEKRK